jgi:hypothetical protein
VSAWKTNLRDAGVLISTFGLAALASAASVSSAGSDLTRSVLTSVLGGIFTNIASEVSAPLLSRISGLVLKKHPAELNHDLQKLLIRAINNALQNTEVLYKEQYSFSPLPPSPKGAGRKWNKDTGVQFLRELRKNVEDLLSLNSGATITNDELQQYLYNNSDESYGNLLDRLQSGYIKENFDENFAKFFRATFPVQLQVCYAELLKDKNNHGAWIAFQKMLMEDTRQGIQEILQRQEKLEQGITDLQSQKWLEKLSRLSPKKTDALRSLLQEMNQPEKIELKFNRALEERLDAGRKELLAIQAVLHKTSTTVQKTHTDVKLIKTKLIRYLLVAAIIIIILSVTAFVIWNNQKDKPFNVNVIVHGNKGMTDHVLKNTGTLTLSYGQQTVNAKINENGEAFFKEIPAAYKDDSAIVQLTNLNGLPYKLSCGDDCKILLSPANAYLEVKATGLDSIKGQVTAEGYALKDALVIVKGISVTSDESGNFLLIVPEDKQELRQQVNVTKPGYKSWTRWVNSPDWIPVHLEK